MEHQRVWVRSDAGARFRAVVRLASVLAGAGVVAFLLFAAPGRGAGPVVPFRIVLTNAAFATLAVDHRGVAYGVAETGATSLYRLYSSTDEGQTWTAVADFPSCSRVTDLSVLSDDTLLAHVNNCANVAIYRSADHGATWKTVFTFPQPDDYRTLTPHSITDDGQAVYVGSYNTLDSSNHENWVWRSLDDGQTWQVVLDTTTHRHIHFVQADPTTHWVYVGYGDEGVAEIDVTRDQGATWSPLCTGDQCLAVDIAFDPSGFAIFGQDLPYGSDNIQRVNLATGAVSTIMPLPGISYSSMRLPGGVWLIGTTHGAGTAYVPGDLDVHLFASIDNGQTFSDVYDTPYDPNDCCYALKVQFAYPNGDFPIQVGGGTLVAHIDTAPSPPTNTNPPTISGNPVNGQLLSAATGAWTGSPTGYSYEWRRCDATGAGCVAIASATLPGYTLLSADVGHTLRVAATASNAEGNATAVSTQTAAVTSANAVLVVVAHPDDEALGFAGVIESAVAQGRPVYVAVVTNGDASQLGSDTGYCGASSGAPATTAHYGLRRDGETLAAMSLLGLVRTSDPASTRVFFLGYPDGGLQTIASSGAGWTGDATGLHRTYAEDGDGSNSSCNGDLHYQLSGMHAPLSASGLSGDLDSLIALTRPADVYTNAAFDGHPDHATLHQFVVDAVQRSGLTPVVHSTLMHPSGSGSCMAQSAYMWPNPSDPAGVNPNGRFTPTLDVTGPPTPVCSSSPTGQSWGSAGPPSELAAVPADMRSTDPSTNKKWQVISQYASQINCTVNPDGTYQASCGYMRAFVKAHEFFWTETVAQPPAACEHEFAGDQRQRGGGTGVVGLDRCLDGQPQRLQLRVAPLRCGRRGLCGDRRSDQCRLHVGCR